MTNRHAQTRECRSVGARCWISPESHFRPHPEAPNYTAGTIVALGEWGAFWVRIPHRCVLVDQRGLIYSCEYQTRRGKWIPESDSKVRPYFLFKLEEARGMDTIGSMGLSHRTRAIQRYKHALRRNGWFANDLPDDGDGP